MYNGSSSNILVLTAGEGTFGGRLLPNFSRQGRSSCLDSEASLMFPAMSAIDIGKDKFSKVKNLSTSPVLVWLDM